MTVPYSPEIEELPDTAVGQLVSAEAMAQDQIADRLVASLLALWATFSAFWDGEASAQFGQRSAQLVRAAQRRTGGITVVHLRRQFRQMELDVPNVQIELPEDLRLGADTDDVYQRPIRKLRYLIYEGMAEEEAAEVVRQRLEAQALTDLQLAKTTAAQQFYYQAPETTIGWRRIIHPELGAVCGLCIAASDRVYHRIQKMSLHPACRCTTAPVVKVNGEVRDPGRALNAADLAAIYAAAGNTTDSRALSKTRIQVRENGELGPILMADGVEYKGPEKVKSQLSPGAVERRLQSIQGQLDHLRSIENPNPWYRDRIEQLEELAAAA